MGNAGEGKPFAFENEVPALFLPARQIQTIRGTARCVSLSCFMMAGFQMYIVSSNKEFVGADLR